MEEDDYAPPGDEALPPAAGRWAGRELRGLRAAAGLGSLLSFCGSSFILYCCFLLRKKSGGWQVGRATGGGLRLLALLSAADVISDASAALHSALDRSGTDEWWCRAEGIAEVALGLPPVLCTGCISYALWHNAFASAELRRRGHQFFWRYAFFCVVVPAVLAAAGAALGAFDAPGGCGWGPANRWRLVVFYGPLSLTVLWNVGASAAVARAVRAAYRRHGHSLSASPGASIARRLLMYPWVPVLTWAAAGALRAYQQLGDGSAPYDLAAVAAGLSRSQGLWDVIVYGTDPAQGFGEALRGACREPDTAPDGGYGPPLHRAPSEAARVALITNPSLPELQAELAPFAAADEAVPIASGAAPAGDPEAVAVSGGDYTPITDNIAVAS
eukprot:TRINITY_DN39939_c0_g1_i1.p1 TRINITY_DN39939_c0_g1~~TRINITY_DN39939_c0_g1_i1.p1  ORF type:complete len:420 (+),score=87.68 TRINITY_DN39939_c0_g1_i1:104-1261(+)